MNETDEYILEAIRVAVWSGFCDADDVDQIIDDIIEDGADEALLRAAIAPEFEKKAQAELSWPALTDCDRLNTAFAAASESGFVALHNAGYTMSDGLSDVSEAAAASDTPAPYYCFYHGQDVQRAINGGGLFVAFGAFAGDAAAKLDAGRALSRYLKDAGLEVTWNGDPETRLCISTFDWKRRYEV